MPKAPLQIGIKRGVHRRDDAFSAAADAAFDPVRGKALESARYRCVRCGLESVATPAPKRRSSSLQVHHLDDDHHNNEPGNLAAYCDLDHAVHHIGCDAPTTGGHFGWASKMRIAHIPGLTSEEVNLLQRAIGAALADPGLKAVADEMLSLLAVMALPVADIYASSKAKDFAAAMAAMTDSEYEERRVDGLRVLFHPDILRAAGEQMVADQPLLATRTWSSVVDLGV